jgi:hypothetical protein
MIKKIKGGSVVEVQGLKCNIPPLGFGISETGEVGPVDVIKRSTKKAEQFWEPQTLPDGFEEKVLAELKIQERDEDFTNPELDQIREREWRRRIYGVWFYNNGQPIYLTGLNYFYLNYWPLDTGLPDFRLIDVEYFYAWMYCVLDPLCLGMIEVRKRRDGKTYRAGCMSYEKISRTEKALGGIQSKNEADAAAVFAKAIVPQFQTLPSFFRPIWDTSQGSTPKGSLRFFKPSVKGGKAQANLRGKELQSQIDFRGYKPKAYDGSKTIRLILDESGKVETDVIDRHLIVKYCCMDNKGKIIGKMLVTSTCEEIGVKYKFDELWEWSNQESREPSGKTKSQLYRFFMPASRAGMYDKYGVPEEEETLREIMEDRAALKNDPDKLIEEMRKRPLTPEEAFRLASNDSIFNTIKLNEQLDYLTWNSQTQRGDFEWLEGKRDTKVEWIPNKKGKFEVAWLPDEELTNKFTQRGNLFYPANKLLFQAGGDPFDYDQTKSTTRSKGTGFVKFKYSTQFANNPFNNSLIVRYANRPDLAKIYYEDMIKMCVFFGCEFNVERNKILCIRYFQERGYGQFLTYWPGEKEPGVYASKEVHQELAELWTEEINSNGHKLFFKDTIKQLIQFDINNTEKFDEVMGAGYTLQGSAFRKVNKEVTASREVTDYFRTYN